MKVAIRPRSHVLRRGVVLAAVGALLVPLGIVGGTSAGAADRRETLDVYTAAVTSEQAGELSRQGLDVAQSRSTQSGVELDLVLSASAATALRDKGVDLKLKRVKGKSIRHEDHIHLNEDGQKFVAKWLAPKLQKIASS